jgi:hypothetical protein
MGNYPGWENETEESLARRTGIPVGQGAGKSGDRAINSIDDGGVPSRLHGAGSGPSVPREPVVDGIPLSAVKASGAPRKQRAPTSDHPHNGPRAGAGGTRQSLDRGRRQGAKWVLVDGNRDILEWKLAQEHKIQGRKFQSRKEAKRYVALLYAKDRGEVRNLRLQVNFPLYARRPDGLMEKVCDYRCDFQYDERVDDKWVDVVEDVKGWKQDAYLLKSKWFAIQHGKAIRET